MAQPESSGDGMDVIGIGALNFDKLYFVDKIARGGEEVAIIGAMEAPGGSSANTIVGLARLGLKTGFIGKVGNDEEGEFILDDLKKEGVDLGGIEKSEGMTGVIIGLIDKRGERALYANPGVNDTLRMDKRAIMYAKKAKFLHLASFVGERSYKAQIELLEELSNVGISFAPGMLYAKKGLNELELMIDKTSVLFLNRRETELLTGWDYRKGAENLVELGAEIVAVTLGKEGCYITSPDGYHFVKAYPTKVVDTTGAGDAFATGFLYGLITEEDLKTCGKLGNWVASKCIEKEGAREGLPYNKDMKEFWKKGSYNSSFKL